jgi:hypothetical protein
MATYVGYVVEKPIKSIIYTVAKPVVICGIGKILLLFVAYVTERKAIAVQDPFFLGTILPPLLLRNVLSLRRLRQGRQGLSKSHE